MLRRDRVSHLLSCPANIITCTQEWNRWPLHCSDRWKTVPFRQRNPRAVAGQLDYELALRDQKMVGEFYKVPRKTKLALRNNLTRRFPALPLPPNISRKSNPTDRSVRSLKDHVKYEVGDENIMDRAVYGVAKIFLKNQRNQEKRWKEDLDHAIQRTGQPVPRRYWEYPELERGNIHKHCAYCYDVNCDIKNRIMTEKCDDFPDDESWTQCCSMMPCPWECGAVYHHCKAFEHKMICPLYEEEGEFDWMNKDKMKMKKEKKPPPVVLKELPDLLTGPTVCPPSVRRRARPSPPPAPPDLTQVMRFDLKIETVTRLQQKPRAMYTFLCGQELRRDQWEDHCRDVHSEIHGGLNNWIEARCPLSTYGCSFSSRRLYPGSDPAARIVYSQDLKSFGVRPASCELTAGSRDSPTLTDLPAELVQLVFSYLDSWSLSSLALVSVRTRQLVCGLLDSKGCVALQWEKVEREGIGSGGHWEVTYKRWFFSSHFSPITRWGLGQVGEVSQHLQSCPYNIRTEHSSPDTKSPSWTALMSAVRERVSLKRDSDWYID